MKTAFLFPGQGSQHPGMGLELAKNFRVAADTFAEADEVLGFPLSRLCFEGPDTELTLTANAQPAILTTSIAALRVVETELGLSPALTAGHSLGEYSALVAAGALAFGDAVRAVRERGRLMQEACPPGTGLMAAIMGLEEQTVEEVCASASSDGELAVPANFNAPGQIVIAGHTPAVRRAVALAKERGAKMATELNVSAPFHCPLMRPAQQGMESVLKALQVRPLKCAMIVNVTGGLNDDSSRVVEFLLEQITAPVRWTESMRTMAKAGIERAIEIGPGRVLSGLVRRFDRKLPVLRVEDLETLQALRQSMGTN